MDPENQNFLKNSKNTSRYYRFTNINDSHVMYGSSDGVQWAEFFVILDQFLPFYAPNNPKNQNLKKWKKHLEILSFYTCVP